MNLDDTIAEVLRLDEAATKGPWVVRAGGHVTSDDGTVAIAVLARDAEAIALYREFAPKLALALREVDDSEVRGEHLLALRHIEALERDNARIREQNDRLGGPAATEAERVGYDRAVAVVEAWGRTWAAQYERGYARNEAERVVGTALLALKGGRP